MQVFHEIQLNTFQNGAIIIIIVIMSILLFKSLTMY